MGRYLTPHLARALTHAYNYSLTRRNPIAAKRILEVDQELTLNTLEYACAHRDIRRAEEMARRAQVLALREAARLGLEHAQREKAQGGSQ